MIYFTDSEIDQLISEDLPYFDLTSHSVKLRSKVARISYTTRYDTVICGTEEVLRIFDKFNVTPTLLSVSGEYIGSGIKFLEGEGLARNIHAIWRATTNLMQFSSGIATRMRTILEAAREINPEVSVVTTRKSIPFTKKLSLKAIQAGGGTAHRLGLSDTVLIFQNHIKFLGGIENVANNIINIKQRVAGRSITVEVSSEADALLIAKSGIHAIQLDNLPADEVKKIVPKLRKLNAGLRIAVAGNISFENVQDYAATGADIIVSSWPYFGKPSDIQVSIDPVFDY